MSRLVVEGLTLREGLAPPCDFACAPGAWHVLFGRRGSGGRGVLDAVSGARPPVAGRVVCDGVDLGDRPPAQRPVVRVGLAPVPYPHLRVAEAMAVPLRARGVKGAEARARVQEIAARLEITGLLAARCGQVSAGLRARVDLARALVRTDATVLLLDALGEGVDRAEAAWLRDVVRAEAAARGLVVLQTCADQREALAVGDRMLAMEDGTVVQEGTPAAVYAAPRTEALAASLGDPGMNLLRGTVRGRWVVVQGARIECAAAERAGSGEVTLGARAEDLALVDVDRDGALAVELRRIEDRVTRRLLVFAVEGRALLVDAPAEVDAVVGHRYGVAFPPGALRLYRDGRLIA